MSNLNDLPIRLISVNSRTAIVEPWGFPMECEYEFEEGEAPILGPNGFEHPGCPDNAVLLSCTVAGVDITEMLSNAQTERLEDAILEQLER
jgi:hypothetical protein